MTVAVVDVGTNSVRQLVARQSDTAHLADVHRDMRITRLGRGLGANGTFDDASLERTLDTIAGYAKTWPAHGVTRVRIAATSAVRDAADAARFFDGVRERTGITAEVLSGAQEAELSFLGGVAGVKGLPGARTPYLLNDIGGGSTELILGETTPVAWTSMQLGCVRLTERALAGDPYAPATVAEARRIAFAELDVAAVEVDVSVRGRIESGQVPTLVGVAGTATTLAALHLGLDAYDPAKIHGTRIPRQAVDALAVWLGGMTNAERGALGPVAPGREDVLVAGAIILSGIMARFRAAEVLVSEADILDGLALSILD